MTVRRARPGDAAAIARIHVAAWKAGYDGLVPQRALAAQDVEERTAQWQARLVAPRLRVLVAEAGDGIAGFAATALAGFDASVTEDMAIVVAFYVHPGAWSRGHGSALIEATIDGLRADGVNRVALWVLTGNDRAERFYARHGFARDGATEVDDRWGTVDFRMTRELRPGAQ